MPLSLSLPPRVLSFIKCARRGKYYQAVYRPPPLALPPFPHLVGLFVSANKSKSCQVNARPAFYRALI